MLYRIVYCTTIMHANISNGNTGEAKTIMSVLVFQFLTLRSMKVYHLGNEEICGRSLIHYISETEIKTTKLT